MGKLRAGIIGADLNLRAAMPFQMLPRDRAEIVAVADRDPEILELCRMKYPSEPAEYYESAEELIADPNVEAVFIMVRSSFHEPLAIQALEAGKSVYLETPMATTIEGCDRILETAFRTGSKLFPGHNMRYMPFARKLREVAGSGVTGEIQSVWVRHFAARGSTCFQSWCAERKNCTGLLLQEGVQDLDVISWIAGAPVRRIIGMGRLSVYNRAAGLPEEISSGVESRPPLELRDLNPEMDVEDHNMLLMELENGVQASYEQCMYTPDNEHNYTFIGTKGRIENSGDGGPGTEIQVWTQPGSRREPDIVHHLRNLPEDGGHGEADSQIVSDFIDFALDRKKAAVSPVDARNAAAAGYLGHYSMRHGNIPCELRPVSADVAEYFAKGQLLEK